MNFPSTLAAGAMDGMLYGALAALPWLAMPAVLSTRLSGALSLDAMPDDALPDTGVPRNASARREPTPRVSIILPARNEAAHIDECMRSIGRSDWPDLELIVVDDHSDDGTGDIARRTAALLGESNPNIRMRIVPASDLPNGWFGKQWACATGAAESTGTLLLFTDADTRHAPGLVRRMVATRTMRGAELISVAGRQDAVTIWERAVQPLVFSMILLRYGTGSMERATRARDVIANGQCFMLSREFYRRIGGHERVRGYVAEDVMMAQTVWQEGGRVSLASGREYISTRMYDGFRSLVQGWSKNVYAGGRHTVPGGAAGRMIFPLLLIAFPLAIILPFIGLCVAVSVMSGAPSGVAMTVLMTWSILASLGVLAMAVRMNVANDDPWTRAVLAPLGGAVLLMICAYSVVRGNSVRWKERSYQAD